MGNANSSRAIPLAPQRRFPRVINARFRSERTTTLRLPLGFWSHTNAAPLPLVDTETHDVVFHVSARRDSTTKPTRLLLDKNRVPAVVLEGFPVDVDYAIYVPTPASLTTSASVGDATAWDESRALCYLQTNMRPLEKLLRLDLVDTMTAEPVVIHVEGSWNKHEAVFLLTRGDNRRECIARVYVEPQQKRRAIDSEIPPSYCVGIAPGVDAALIVLACAALDQELETKESGLAVEIPTDEITKRLAQLHRARFPKYGKNPLAQGLGLGDMQPVQVPSMF